MTDAERMADFHRRVGDLNELDRMELAGCLLISVSDSGRLTEAQQDRLARMADETIEKSKGIGGFNFQCLFAAEIVLRLHRWAKGHTSAMRMVDGVEASDV